MSNLESSRNSFRVTQWIRERQPKFGMGYFGEVLGLYKDASPFIYANAHHFAHQFYLHPNKANFVSSLQMLSASRESVTKYIENFRWIYNRINPILHHNATQLPSCFPDDVVPSALETVELDEALHTFNLQKLWR